MTVSFIGDISLNDNYILLYKKGINPFEILKFSLKESDFVIGNLESIAKGDFGENELKKPRLTTTIETLNYLNKINLSVASLAQNHVYDHLEDGLKKTLEFLKENSIKHLGAGFTKKEASQALILERWDIKIGILNYVTIDTNPNLPNDSRVFLNIFKIENSKNEIIHLKQKVNFVVLSLHWGGRVEGGLYPDQDQPKIARELIDAGADLIIGHHSHTIQPFEVYKGKYIFYSLGNFCFADHLFEGKLQPKSNRNLITIIITIYFNKSDYKVKTTFYRNTIASFVKLNNYEVKLIFRNIIFKYILRFRWLWLIYYFNKKYILPIFLFFNRSDISLKVKLIRFFQSLLKRTKKQLGT